jgi:hypothetical protein
VVVTTAEERFATAEFDAGYVEANRDAHDDAGGDTSRGGCMVVQGITYT